MFLKLIFVSAVFLTGFIASASEAAISARSELVCDMILQYTGAGTPQGGTEKGKMEHETLIVPKLNLNESFESRSGIVIKKNDAGYLFSYHPQNQNLKELGQAGKSEIYFDTGFVLSAGVRWPKPYEFADLYTHCRVNENGFEKDTGAKIDPSRKMLCSAAGGGKTSYSWQASTAIFPGLKVDEENYFSFGLSLKLKNNGFLNLEPCGWAFIDRVDDRVDNSGFSATSTCYPSQNTYWVSCRYL
jgi:hypothetical protein